MAALEAERWLAHHTSATRRRPCSTPRDAPTAIDDRVPRSEMTAAGAGRGASIDGAPSGRSRRTATSSSTPRRGAPCSSIPAPSRRWSSRWCETQRRRARGDLADARAPRPRRRGRRREAAMGRAGPPASRRPAAVRARRAAGGHVRPARSSQPAPAERALAEGDVLQVGDAAVHRHARAGTRARPRRVPRPRRRARRRPACSRARSAAPTCRSAIRVAHAGVARARRRASGRRRSCIRVTGRRPTIGEERATNPFLNGARPGGRAR